MFSREKIGQPEEENWVKQRVGGGERPIDSTGAHASNAGLNPTLFA